jgi:hypothetical protein
MSTTWESIAAFLRHRNPPSPDAPQRDWNGFFLFHLLALRQGQETLCRDLAKLAHDLDVRLTVDEEDERLNGRQLGLHKATLRHLGVCVDQLGKDLEALTPVDGEILDDEPALPAEARS